MIKKKLFKYGSVFMCAAIMAMSISACGTASQSSKSDTNTQSAVSAEYSAGNDSESILVNAINSQLLTKADGTKVSTVNKNNTKEETVYVFADANGKQDHLLVNEKLRNIMSKQSIEDATSLKDIKNLTGDEESTSGSGNSLTWKANGNSITYQGTSSKEVPVTMKVTYYLNDEEISPDNLAGKSGKVKIRFDYTNNEKQTVNINGKEKEVCVPFTMITGMLLPSDKFSNIEVTNGKVMDYNDGNIVLGITVPGLKESLDLTFDGEKQDIDIPDYFEVSADVDDFELDTTMSVATSNVFSDFNTDDLSVDSLTGKADELQDGSNQLMDGSSQLADGSAQLKEGSDKLKEGAGELKAGTGELAGKVPELTGGVKSLDDGAGQLSAGLNQLNGQVPTLTGGISALDAGAGKLSAGINQLSSKVPELSAGITAIDEGAGQLQEGINSLYAGFKGDGTAANPGLVNGMASLNNGINTLSDQVNATFGKGGALEQQAKGAASNADMLAKAGQLDKIGNATIPQANNMKVNDILGSLDSNLKITITTDLTNLAKSKDMTTESAKLIQKYMNAYQFAVSNKDSQTQVGQTITSINNAVYQATGGAYDLPGVYMAEMQLLMGTVKNETVAGTLNEVSKQGSALTSGVAQLKAGSNKLSAGVGTYDELTGKSAPASGDTIASGLYKLTAGSSQLKAGTSKLSGSVPELSNGITALNSGAGELKAGTGKLSEGAGSLANGVGQLNEGAGKLKIGTGQLYQAAGALANGVSKLDDGAKQLANGTVDLQTGAGQLNEGAIALKDGTIKFNDEGIKKITSLVGNDAKDAVETIKQIAQLGKDYQSFAGKSDDIEGSVKFIYKTDGINK